jgi:hypothetical protein
MDFTLGLSNLSTPFSFSIPTHNRLGNEIKRIGVYSPGELGATALLCLIISELIATNRLDTISVMTFTVLKRDGSKHYSKRIIDKISAHFYVPIINIDNIENNEPAFFYNRIGKVPFQRVYDDYSHDTDIYQGNNRMAPDDIRPFTQSLGIYYHDEQVLWKSPFLDLHKPQILDLYYKLGCEDIIPWTHSCTVMAQGKCDNCYSCKEREWAFSALEKKYLDTIPLTISDISSDGTWKYS